MSELLITGLMVLAAFVAAFALAEWAARRWVTGRDLGDPEGFWPPDETWMDHRVCPPRGEGVTGAHEASPDDPRHDPTGG
jgi:hypothetical protein